MFGNPNPRVHNKFIEKVHSKNELVKSLKMENTKDTACDFGPRVDRHECQDTIDLMGEILEASGHHHHLNNLSKNSKPKLLLGEIKTEPAVDLLSKTNWRKFFEDLKSKKLTRKDKALGFLDDMDIDNRGFVYEKTNINVSRNEPNTKRILSGQKIKINRPLSASLDNIRSEKEKAYFTDNLSFKLKNMIIRVENIWNELKFPVTDRKFFRSSLFHSESISIKQCIESARYLNSLLEHRRATIKVLRAISVREICIEICYDILSAISRKSLRSNQAKTLSDSWRSDLAEALEDIALASVSVVDSIQKWREGLWRPQAFVWKGSNYYDKMKTDMQILETDSFNFILHEKILSPLGLLCVTFSSSDFEDIVDSIDENDKDLLRLKVTSLTVIREKEVQEALELENKTLAKNGAFIPKLKIIPSSSSKSDSTSESTNQFNTLAKAISMSYLETENKISNTNNYDHQLNFLDNADNLFENNDAYDKLSSIFTESADNNFWLSKENSNNLGSTSAFENLSQIVSGEENLDLDNHELLNDGGKIEFQNNYSEDFES